MKSLIQAVIVAAVLAAPVATFAESNQPVTRAQVRAELVQLEKAGYNTASRNEATYPAEIQAAEARVAAQNVQNSMAHAHVVDTSGVGGVVSGSSQSDRATETTVSTYSPPIYRAH
ncbi:hypothetical protein AYM40_07345 [Paraburkholderia phytofirmans OLGA172]|uniref:Purine-nucleoside phosphorylase n=1 Tax=Paraburkholderia phytofirmans OLGA172 TaxID=1417228 RepID=A0A160FIS7_9BURK|nr:DUF4148 domain-containing protein [Paraburkholderia phytofirmans]ANB72199.1 hypothetical protein AYM40_07345 [Paraburkholderia phytofirmans OLGA172]